MADTRRERPRLPGRLVFAFWPQPVARKGPRRGGDGHVRFRAEGRGAGVMFIAGGVVMAVAGALFLDTQLYFQPDAQGIAIACAIMLSGLALIGSGVWAICARVVVVFDERARMVVARRTRLVGRARVSEWPRDRCRFSVHRWSESRSVQGTTSRFEGWVLVLEMPGETSLLIDFGAERFSGASRFLERVESWVEATGVECLVEPGSGLYERVEAEKRR